MLPMCGAAVDGRPAAVHPGCRAVSGVNGTDWRRHESYRTGGFAAGRGRRSRGARAGRPWPEWSSGQRCTRASPVRTHWPGKMGAPPPSRPAWPNAERYRCPAASPSYCPRPGRGSGADRRLPRRPDQARARPNPSRRRPRGARPPARSRPPLPGRYVPTTAVTWRPTTCPPGSGARALAGGDPAEAACTQPGIAASLAPDRRPARRPGGRGRHHGRAVPPPGEAAATLTDLDSGPRVQADPRRAGLHPGHPRRLGGRSRLHRVRRRRGPG